MTPRVDHTEDPETGLDAKQEAAIVALLEHVTVPKASAAAGVGERTLWRWLDDPAFNKEYMRRRRQAFGQSIALLQRYSVLAVQALAKIVNDDSVSPSAKVSAASAILKFGREGLEIDDLAARIWVLEHPNAPTDAFGRPISPN